MCAVETKMSSTRFGMPCKYSLYVCRIDIMRMIGWMRSQFTYEWKERDLKTLWLNLEVDYGEGKELNKRDLFCFACAVALSFCLLWTLFRYTVFIFLGYICDIRFEWAFILFFSFQGISKFFLYIENVFAFYIIHYPILPY